MNRTADKSANHNPTSYLTDIERTENRLNDNCRRSEIRRFHIRQSGIRRSDIRRTNRTRHLVTPVC